MTRMSEKIKYLQKKKKLSPPKEPFRSPDPTRGFRLGGTAGVHDIWRPPQISLRVYEEKIFMLADPTGT